MEKINIGNLTLSEVKSKEAVELEQLEVEGASCGMRLSVALYKGMPRLRLEGELRGFAPFVVGHYPVTRSGLAMVKNAIGDLDSKTIHLLAAG
ncbi:hypothetical protein [Vibrio owensii]|uniref:hypothetical protein n=1 Tax=Vibrio owensii TaxID=696485 RepID=UPI0018F1A9CC|nr:hypothetical protein [Vibrio owensii]